MKPKLSLEARRIKTIIVALPIMVACSLVLYKRQYLGEERRQLPTTLTTENRNVRLLDSEKEKDKTQEQSSQVDPS
ncbi:hypothetical protein M413DRAFT_146983 [Hebeloma cylindrosporum]|uniref:Uncharacterized protein n=1 Tax=Hebeloma cylindrosporum TaxID=76867 RepID=A0A0C3CAW4_HEBCY|nr:hypothetical protein M413DRAFT_146983 [Hebeloma cylindrosporum h7]